MRVIIKERRKCFFFYLLSLGIIGLSAFTICKTKTKSYVDFEKSSEKLKLEAKQGSMQYWLDKLVIVEASFPYLRNVLSYPSFFMKVKRVK